MTTLRNLPSIDQLLQTENAAYLIARFGRPLTLDAIRFKLDEIRARFKSGEITALPLSDLILVQVESTLIEWTHPTLIPVINASGVILHTNLGRAPMSDATIRAMDAVSRGYSNLEFDLTSGKRGSRLIHAEALLQKITSAEAAVIVNNNASAVLLVLSAWRRLPCARCDETIGCKISRSRRDQQSSYF
jgi:L-seryl-tRNA(Ser) seleniumtransferase